MKSTKVVVETEFAVECGMCGTPLRAELVCNDDDVHLEVELCKDCVEAAIEEFKERSIAAQEERYGRG